MTEDFKKLYEKAIILADLCDYALKEIDGKFMFYDSPSFKSFAFRVDPKTFTNGDVIYYLYKKFEERIYV